jgi:hypothetical protein
MRVYFLLTCQNDLYYRRDTWFPSKTTEHRFFRDYGKQ